jgi:hypothetical protein
MAPSQRLAALRERIPDGWVGVVYGLILAVVAAILAVFAYRLMFSTFDVPDDAGYVLMTIKKFDGGGSLYHDVYSQYGPGVPVLVGGLLRIFGVGITVETALFWNWVVWILSSLFIGLALLRLTRRLLVSGIGLALAFLILKVDVNEPLHPGATIAFLLTAIIVAAVFLLPQRPRAALAVVGALAAAILSLKVNVGLFALLSIAFALVSTVPALLRWKILRVAVALAFVVIPFPLMSENLGHSWAFQFALMVAVGALGLVVVSVRARPVSAPDGRAVVAGIVSAVVIGLLVAIVPIIGGTSPGDLVNGWLLRPAGTAELAHAALYIDGRAWWWASAGLALALLAARYWNRLRPPGLDLAIAGGRIAVGLVMWIGLAGPVFHLPTTLTQGLVVGAPFLWVAALPPRGREDDNSFVRLLIPALAALQFLHAYPMPGSQLNWSVLLVVPVGGICIADGLEELAVMARGWRPATGDLVKLVPTLAVLAFGVWLALKPIRNEARLADARYNESVPLELTGASNLRVNGPLAEQLQTLVAGAQAHCDTFLTFPGMNSLNLLAGEEPPVELSSPWPYFFTASEQQEIVDKVKDAPRLCVIHKPDLVEFWGAYFGGAPPRRPLVDFMENDFHEVHNYSGYILLARNH